MAEKRKRTVRPESFLDLSWHCKETTSFRNFLGNYRSGIGRSMLKAQALERHVVSIGQATVLYTFPEKASEGIIREVVGSWNSTVGKALNAPAEYAEIQRDGRTVARRIYLKLDNWEAKEAE